MCGIAGIIAFSERERNCLNAIAEATECLVLRGPDDGGTYTDGNIAFGHRRLSVIDVSHEAAQPMHDVSGRYTIIFNGEFFNYRQHRKILSDEGVLFRTASDTEVLLNLYIKEGPSCLQKVNGFFALAIYDNKEQSVLIARDRYGVKPLLYYNDGRKMFFSSELKALLKMGVPADLDHNTMHLYFQLNYVPPDSCMLQGVKKLRPGHYILLSTANPLIKEEKYYGISISYSASLSYADAQQEFMRLLNAAVQRRMVSDVPLGAFLSGGIDSSAIVALASRHVSRLNTYSIGFTDHPHFDETRFAELVARKFNTSHHSFRLNDDSLFEIVFNVLDYLDEPFADSSALNVYILSRETRKHVTVALSGDGADELLAGYRKHKAEWYIRNKPWMKALMQVAALPAGIFGGSRNNRLADRLRQIKRFAEGAKLNAAERYWQWCCITPQHEADVMLLPERYNDNRQNYNRAISESDFNSVLYCDMNLVLPGDMLVKVDMMSMANSLEVRNPFLDVELVDFVFSLPTEYKINQDSPKRILYDSFHDILPHELFNRRKQGFEVPLLNWFRNKLKPAIDELLDDDYIRSQQLFNPEAISRLRKKLHSSHPGDAAAKIWALLVFQYWFKRVMK